MQPLDPGLIEAVKRFEGFQSRPYWDYRQFTSGYGTRASSPGEVIDRQTAESRLQDALAAAAGQVDARFPNLPGGVRNALTSLTFNAGPSWMNGGLGQAIASGDMDRARTLFQQYNHAGGQVNPGLTQRRMAEASWFDQNPPRPPMPIPNVAQPAQSLPDPSLAYATPNLPLFSPQAPAPQPQAPSPSFFSFLQPGSADEARWFNFQNPLG
jgi:lysozyme